MTIVRAPRPEGNFYILDKAISEDPRLSWAARGLLVYLLGKPDHWRVSRQALVNETAGTVKPAGREAIASLIAELVAAGYCAHRQLRNADGTHGLVEYAISETPLTGQLILTAKKEASVVASEVKPSFDPWAGKFHGLSDALRAKWRASYPLVDTNQEIERASAWLLANPAQAKKNYARFLNGWLSRAQDRAASDAHQASRTGASAPGRPMSRAERVQADGAILTGFAPEAYQSQPASGRWTDWPSDTIDAPARVVPDAASSKGAL